MNVLYAVGQGRRESAVSPESGPDILPARQKGPCLFLHSPGGILLQQLHIPVIAV